MYFTSRVVSFPHLSVKFSIYTHPCCCIFNHLSVYALGRESLGRMCNYQLMQKLFFFNCKVFSATVARSKQFFFVVLFFFFEGKSHMNMHIRNLSPCEEKKREFVCCINFYIPLFEMHKNSCIFKCSARCRGERIEHRKNNDCTILSLFFCLPL